MRSPRPALQVSSFVSPIGVSAIGVSAIISCLLISSSLAFGATPDRITSPIDTGKMVQLHGGVPLKAKPQYDQGGVDSSLPLSYMTLLTVPSASQKKALKVLLAEQQDRHSPLYHQWLTPEQYAERFGLSPSDLQKITAWLQSEGFSIISIARGGNFVVFSGTAAQAEGAFKTQIHNFEVDGKKNFGNTSSPSVPAALSGIVTGVRGLSNFKPKPNFKLRNSQYTYTTSGGSNRYLAPGDISTIYSINQLYALSPSIDGSGQKLAVVGQTDIYLADVVDFRSTSSPTGFALPAITGCNTGGSGLVTSCGTASTNYLQYILIGTDPDEPSLGDLPEADLDLEWSGAVAKNAQIVYVNAPDTDFGVWDSWYYAVDHDVAPVITMSYTAPCEEAEADYAANGGTGEGTFASDESELQEANSEGITFMNSSGDSGAASCDPDSNLSGYGLAVAYPASSQYVTGVGGTMIPYDIAGDGAYYGSTYWSATNNSNGGSAKSYIPENAWDDSVEFGAYCTAFPADTFCMDYGITDQESAQLALGMGSGGGGYSGCTTLDENFDCLSGFAQPSWQAVTVAGQAGARLVPDVSLLASPNWPGYIWCTPIEELSNTPPYETETTSSCAGGVAGAVAGVKSGGNYVVYPSIVGGTSASSPVFAGIVALLNQYVGDGGLGNINPILYLMGATTPSAFNQVTAGTDAPGANTVYCDPGSPGYPPVALECPAAIPPAIYGLFGYYTATDYAASGYNLADGLGSVNAYELATNWSAAAAYNATTTVVTSNVNPAGAGATVTFTATVGSGGAAPTGSVTFSDLGTTIGAGTLSTTGGGQQATFATSSLAVGAHSIAALYTGDSSNAGSISPVLTETITSGGLSSTTTTLVSSLNPASVGASVTFTATVSTTGSNPPTGTVTFYNGATSLGAETLGTVGGAQVATLTTSSLPAGSDSITAVYGGDSNNAGSTSSVLIQVINGDATTTALTSSLNPAGDGVSVTFTAKVTTTGTHVPTGTVSFENGGVIFGSPVTLTALNGTQATAAITTSTLPVGTDSITAVYSGDSNNGGSTSNTVSQVINPPTFIFSTEPSAPAAVLSGGFTTSTFTLTPGGGTFAQAVTFACTGSSLPAATSCGFSPTQIAAGAGATQVTLTIQTTGPNADVQGGIRRRADNRSPVLPFALPLAGIVAAGFAGRKFWRHSAWAGLGVSLLLLGLLIACGGSSNTPPITITVSPSAVTLYPNDAADSWPPQTATFTATVTNTNNSAVTWAVTTTNGGTISAGGVYTAPTIASGLPTTATIMATSQADTTKTATAVVNITPTTVPGTYPGITVTATEGPTVNTSSAISLTVN
jgi:hypothetical protein